MVFSFGSCTVHLKIKPVDITFLFPGRKIKICAACFQYLFAESRPVVLIGIGPDMKIDEGKRVRGIVGIDDPFKTIQGFFLFIQCYFNGISKILLPVLAET